MLPNACTGVEGDNACAEEAKAVAKVLNVPENAVLIGSTGVIGMRLPVDRICAGIENLAPMLDDSLEAGTQAKRGNYDYRYKKQAGCCRSRSCRY